MNTPPLIHTVNRTLYAGRGRGGGRAGRSDGNGCGAPFIGGSLAGGGYGSGGWASYERRGIGSVYLLYGSPTSLRHVLGRPVL